MTSLASLASVVMSCAGPLPVKFPVMVEKGGEGVENPWSQGATHTTSRDRRTDRAVEKRIFFSQKPPAHMQVMPFLGVYVDLGFSRSGGVVGWKRVGIDGVKS